MFAENKIEKVNSDQKTKVGGGVHSRDVKTCKTEPRLQPNSPTNSSRGEYCVSMYTDEMLTTNMNAEPEGWCLSAKLTRPYRVHDEGHRHEGRGFCKLRLCPLCQRVLAIKIKGDILARLSREVQECERLEWLVLPKQTREKEIIPPRE
jgi:hypothetical protein